MAYASGVPLWSSLNVSTGSAYSNWEHPGWSTLGRYLALCRVRYHFYFFEVGYILGG